MMRLSQQKGFTLLEILVAIAILAVVGVTLMSSTTSHIYNQGILQEQMLGQWVASNRLAEIKLDAKWPIENNKKGDMEMAGNKYFWKQEVLKTQDPSMVRVDVVVYTDEAYESSILNMGTYISKKAK